MISQYLKRKSVLLTLAAAGVVSATAALALVVGAGGNDIRVDVRSETVPSASNAVVFVDVPGANVVVNVPAGQSRLFVARFAGESQCVGAAAAPAAWCSLQIIASTAAGAPIPFDPAAGLDYAFDSNPLGAADDQWEGNAMERSKRLRAGTYRIRVQRAVTNNQTFFRLDDWHFSVETRL
jgi:hypothetical protein